MVHGCACKVHLLRHTCEQQTHSSRLFHQSGTARINFNNMLFPLVSEGWTAREGYWRNTSYSSTDYQRQFPLKLCTAIIWNSYNGKYCCLYCKGFCYRCEPLPNLSATTPRTLAKPGQGHEHETPHQPTMQGKRMSWYKILLPDWTCTKKALKEQLWSGTHPVWSNTAAAKAGYQSCPCWFPGNKHSYKKHTHPLAQRWSSGLRPVLLGFLCRLCN